jgi:hypothetical protein
MYYDSLLLKYKIMDKKMDWVDIHQRSACESFFPPESGVGLLSAQEWMPAYASILHSPKSERLENNGWHLLITKPMLVITAMADDK